MGVHGKVLTLSKVSLVHLQSHVDAGTGETEQGLWTRGWKHSELWDRRRKGLQGLLAGLGCVHLSSRSAVCRQGREMFPSLCRSSVLQETERFETG